MGGVKTSELPAKNNGKDTSFRALVPPNSERLDILGVIYHISRLCKYHAKSIIPVAVDSFLFCLCDIHRRNSKLTHHKFCESRYHLKLLRYGTKHPSYTTSSNHHQGQSYSMCNLGNRNGKFGCDFCSDSSLE